MRPGDADPALAAHDLAEHFGPPRDRDSAAARLIDLVMRSLDRRRDDDEVDALEVLAVVPDDDGNAPALQQVSGRRRLQIAPRHRDPRLRENLGDATHSDPADADEMNGPNLIKIHSDLIS